MAKTTNISWCDATFNPWWGCEKVSPACTHCYAETAAKRYGHSVWGKGSARRFFSDRHWHQPIKWDCEAKLEGVRKRVFCASMADVFEDRPELVPVRDRLWDLIDGTPRLDWLLLTKRPQNIERMLPEFPIPENVWMGTTAETQEYWNIRVPILRRVPCKIRFVSVEPMLGPIHANLDGIHWVLVGGESGAGARRMDPEWVHRLRGQCDQRGVMYHFKQLGEVLAREFGCKNRKGGDPAEWPQEFRIQEFPL